MRPVAGVIGLALEARQALEVRRARVGKRAGRHDDVLRRISLAVVGGDGPAVGVLVEHGRRDAGVELDVGTQVEAVGDVVGVLQDLGLGGEALGPLPLLLQLVRERIRILHAFDVAARAGIAVPVPGAADAGPLLEHPHRQAEGAQAMQQVHAGKTRADDDHVVAFGRGLRVALGLGHCMRLRVSLWPAVVSQLLVCGQFSIPARKAQVTISARPSPIPRGAANRPRTAGTFEIPPSDIFAVDRRMV